MDKRFKITANKKSTYNKAFTLAEVLSVVVILGVVASIMIPTTIRNVKRKETLTRFKMAYNLLTDVTERSRIENGFPPRGIGHAQFFNTYLRPYLQIAKDCGVPDRVQKYKTDDNGNFILDADGNRIKDGFKFRNENDFENNRCFAGPSGGIYGLNDSPNENNSSYGDSYNVVLKNGMALSVRPGGRGFQDNLIFVDIDGPKKGYSKLGQDTFMFTWAGTDTLSICDSAYCRPHQTNVPELIPGFTVWYLRYPVYYITPQTRSDWGLNGKCTADGAGGNGVPGGGLCSVLIIENNFQYPANYPFNQAFKKPKGFIPVK